MRSLKSLEGAVGVSVVHPTWQRTRPDEPDDTHCGWVFADAKDAPLTPVSGSGAVACEGCVPDSINGASSVRALYDLDRSNRSAGAKCAGKYTVPVLWDKKTSTIVNNESAEIVRMLDGVFCPRFGDASSPSLYPPAARAEIDAVNAWVYDSINNGVYKCGFATTQAAYDAAACALFTALDRVETILEAQRYIVSGSQLTEADVRLFMTLVRFDEVYVVYFKCNKRALSTYPNMRNYMRELFQLPSIRDNVHMAHIKAHYFTSHAKLNAYSIIPVGPDVVSDLNMPHDRDRFKK